MTTSQPDYVVVDDTSTQIKYSTGWTELLFNAIVGATGPPLYTTLHVATSPASFTFTYSGSSDLLSVMGSKLNNSFPIWQCMLDNNTMFISDPRLMVLNESNQFSICNSSSSAASPVVGDHTVTVSVAAAPDNPAYFDYISYIPAPGVSDGDFMFLSTNVGFTYSGFGWKSPPEGGGVATSNPGDTVDLEFNGHSVSWVGFFNFNGSIGTGPASATYSIDGSSPIIFSFDNRDPATDSPLSKMVFFQTEQLVPGQHHLQVVAHGAPGVTPLSLEHLIIQNSTTDFELEAIPAVTAPVSLPSVPAKNATHRDAAPHSVKLAGISIGILGILCIAIVFGCWIRRRRARSRAPEASSQFPRPFHHNNRRAPISEKARQQQISTTDAFLDVEQHSPSISRMSKARRLAEAAAATFRRDRSRAAGRTSEPGHNSPAEYRVTSTRRVIMHEDSGVPLPQPEEEGEVIEIPPAYVSIR